MLLTFRSPLLTTVSVRGRTPNKGINAGPLQQAFYMQLRFFAYKKLAITGRLSQR